MLHDSWLFLHASCHHLPISMVQFRSLCSIKAHSTYFSSIHHYHTTSLYPWLSPVYKHIHNYHSCFFTAMLPRSRTLPSRIYNGVVRSCPYLSIFLGEIVLFSSDILALHRCFRWKSGKTSGTTCRWKSSLNPMARVKQ